VADETCWDLICREAMRVSEELEKQVIDEDAVDEGFLVPVKNIWIVNKLRMEIDALKAVLEEKEKALVEKDKAVAEEREANIEKDRIIAEFERRYGEE